MPSARNNNFGSHEFHTDHMVLKEQWYSPSGEHYTQWKTERTYDHYCERYGQSKNPLRPLIEGGLPVWRNPSPYSRFIVDSTYQKGRHRLQTTNQWGETTRFEDEGFAFAPTGSDHWTESRFSMGGGGPPWPSDLENAAIAKGISEVKGNVAQMGEDLAEMRATYSMLTETVFTLAGAIRAVKRGDAAAVFQILKNRKSVVRRGSDLWLQYNYGWKPLVTTIYDLASELWREYPRVPVLHYKKGFKRTTTNLILPPWLTGNGSVEINGRLSWSYKLTNGYIGTTMDKIGLSNPLSLGWQLIPYSFVVDWFLPVGSILDSFTPPQGTEFIGGSSVAHFKGQGTYTSLAVAPVTEVIPMTTTFRTVAMERHAYTDWPLAGLYVKSPFSLSHGITSVALLLQDLLD